MSKSEFEARSVVKENFTVRATLPAETLKKREKGAGVVDDHNRVTLGDLCQFISGNGFRPSDWKSSGLPIIRIQNLNGSRSFNYFDGEPDG